jgi:hypothetical protein
LTIPALSCKLTYSSRYRLQEGTVADDQAEIIRLLKALNGKEPPEISRRSDDNDAANWVARALRWGADLGLSPEVSTLILSETLHKILRRVLAPIERESAARELN